MSVIASALFCLFATVTLCLAIAAEEKHQRQLVEDSRLAAHVRKNSST